MARASLQQRAPGSVVPRVNGFPHRTASFSAQSVRKEQKGAITDCLSLLPRATRTSSATNTSEVCHMQRKRIHRRLHASPQNVPEVMSVRDAAAHLGISMYLAYRYLPSIRIGRHRLVPVSALRRLIDSPPDARGER